MATLLTNIGHMDRIEFSSGKFIPICRAVLKLSLFSDVQKYLKLSNKRLLIRALDKRGYLIRDDNNSGIVFPISH